MNRIVVFLVAIINFFLVTAQTYTESYNTVSDGYSNRIENIKIVRNINGGTVIIPEFDESCPEEMKAAFSYACKIVEEYLPPCLPLRVHVTVEPFYSQQANNISKLISHLEKDLGNAGVFLMSRIKAVILAEIANNSNKTFRPYIPNVAFLTDVYDIEISYNKLLLDEISFSLESSPDNLYDFVSLALRDLIKGLGLNSGFRYNKMTKGLEIPGRTMTYFELQINAALGRDSSDIERFNNATKGELKVPNLYNPSLRLYAPKEWENGVSLNYFIPQEDSDVSNLLTNDFCKGMVYRSLSDDYQDLIFTKLLGWFPDKPSGSHKTIYSSQGSTSMFMPYLGSINTSNYLSETCSNAKDNRASKSVNETFEEPSNALLTLAFIEEESPELTNYFSQFHPFLTGDLPCSDPDISVSILKKDGSWDVMEVRSYGGGESINMADWTFHYDESEYARTIDGYLRGRITYLTAGLYTTEYKSKFFVIDYLPQKVNLKCKPVSSIGTSRINTQQASSAIENVRIYFSNIEGVEQIILERLKQGSRIPNKITITDFKKGYYDTTIDRTTTFTAVVYNKNGSSRGLPVTIVPSNAVALTNPIAVNVSERCIDLKSEISESVYYYEIRPLNLSNYSPLINGTTEETIDISELPKGEYVLSVIESNSNSSTTAKFRK